MDFLKNLFSPSGCMPPDIAIYGSQSYLAARCLGSANRDRLSFHSRHSSLFHSQRRDLPFNWMFILFGVFILACGPLT